MVRLLPSFLRFHPLLPSPSSHWFLAIMCYPYLTEQKYVTFRPALVEPATTSSLASSTSCPWSPQSGVSDDDHLSVCCLTSSPVIRFHFARQPRIFFGDTAIFSRCLFTLLENLPYICITYGTGCGGDGCVAGVCGRCAHNNRQQHGGRIKLRYGLG